MVALQLLRNIFHIPSHFIYLYFLVLSSQLSLLAFKQRAFLQCAEFNFPYSIKRMQIVRRAKAAVED